MAIVALFSLLLLFGAGLAVSTHLWWGDSFTTWWRASGASMYADLTASLERRWSRLLSAFAGQSVAVSRLERFAERQSVEEVQSINPFGDASELPRRSLRALANRAPAANEGAATEHATTERATAEGRAPAPAAVAIVPPELSVSAGMMTEPASTGSDWALVKIDSAMTARILGATAQPGDVWLNLTRVENWESPRERRAFLIDEVRLHPEWTDEDIYDIGMAIGLWDDDSTYSANRARNRQRVRRLRLAAERDAAQRPAA
jgi:hypothetical protein